jgi:NAD(P)H-hydrate epimerase
VDAIFGTGLRGAVRDDYVPILDYLNALSVPRLAVDIPSGVVADDGSVKGTAFRADLTVTMALPKVGHFLPPGIDCTGEVEVVDIGIPKDVLENKGESPAEMLTGADMASLVPRYARSAHKGDRGRLLILAGSPGLTGAGCLAAEAALHTGAGLVTVGVPEGLNPIFETKLTEAMTLPLPATAGGALASGGLDHILEFCEQADAVVFGPGVGRDRETGELLAGLLERCDMPVLVDADGLTLLAETPALLSKRPGTTILTPHPGEMARLVGGKTDEVQRDRWGVAGRFAAERGVTLVLKGAGTVIADGERRWVNPTGGPAMSQGGMGDVLSGVIGSLLTQGLGAADAARLGVYIHGLAGDLAAEEEGGTVVLASEVNGKLRPAMTRLLTGTPASGGRRE